jgi:branched-chain amino acid aminotransferase
MTNVFQIPYEEIKEFDEVLAAGTAAALLPIKSITMKSKNDKITFAAAETEPGPVCVKLLETLRGLQQGKLEDKQGWLYKVERPVLGKGTGVFRAGP